MHYSLLCDALAPAERGDLGEAPSMSLHRTTEDAMPCELGGWPGASTWFTGAEMPDAFFFAAAQVTGAAQGCPATLAGFHSPVFAGYLVDAALSKMVTREATSNGTRARDFDALGFALGFGSHVIGDLPAFIPGGYLGNGSLPPATSSPPRFTRDWVALWSFMASVDGFVLDNATGGAARAPVAISLGDDAAALIESAAATFRKSYPDAPDLSAQQALACMGAWENVVATELQRAAAMPLVLYGWSMITNDQYGATTLAEAASHAEVTKRCAVALIREWHTKIVGERAGPEEAANSTLSLLSSLVEQGKCNPTSAAASPSVEP